MKNKTLILIGMALVSFMVAFSIRTINLGEGIVELKDVFLGIGIVILFIVCFTTFNNYLVEIKTIIINLFDILFRKKNK